ncbi:MAG: hypothetical protein LBT55_07400 [Clostridiaceae bacterium]|jgi:hypothetical protein|nr:hypothetical protein [Clostridiaceae bacterium]
MKKRSLFIKILTVALMIILSIAMLSACVDKPGEEVDETEARERAEAVNRFEAALLSLGGEGWTPGLSVADAASISNELDYYVSRRSVRRFAVRTGADAYFQTSKINYFSGLLEAEAAKNFALDPLDRTDGIDFIRVLEGYDIVPEDLAELTLVAFDTAVNDAETALAEAVSDVNAALDANTRYALYKNLVVYRLGIEARIADTKTDFPGKDYDAKLAYLKSVDNTYEGVPDRKPAVPVSSVMANNLLKYYKEAEARVKESGLEGAYAEYKAQADAAEAALKDYVAELENVTEEDASDAYLVILAATLKTAIGSALDLDAPSAVWRDALKLQAERFIKNKINSVPSYKFFEMANGIDDLNITLKSLNETFNAPDFKAGAQTLSSNRETVKKLLIFSFKTGKVVERVLGDSDIDGETLINADFENSAEAVQIIKSFGLAAKEIGADLGGEEFRDVSEALGICVEPLTAVLNNGNVASWLNTLMGLNTTGDGYAKALKLFYENFDILPLLLKSVYAAAYFGVDEFSVDILVAEQEKTVEPEFSQVAVAKILLAIADVEANGGALSKADFKGELARYFAKINGSADRNNLIAGYVEFWTWVNLALAFGSGTEWQLSTPLTVYPAPAELLTTSQVLTITARYSSMLRDLKAAYASNSKDLATLKSDVEAWAKSGTGDYTKIVVAAEAELNRLNNLWFTGLETDLARITDLLYSPDEIIALRAVVAVYDNIDDAKLATEAGLQALRNCLIAAKLYSAAPPTE